MSLQIIIEIASFLAMTVGARLANKDYDRHCEAPRSNLCIHHLRSIAFYKTSPF